MMKRRYPEKSNILLVNITRLGDMLQATPTIAGMKMENPTAKITVLVEKQFEGVCKIIPHIDEIIGLDLGMTVRSLAREGDGIMDAYDYVDEVVTDLQSRNFDYVLNMSSSGYTALLLNLLGIKRRGGWTADDQGYRVIESDWARLFASSVFHTNRVYCGLNLVDVFRCSADVEKHPNNLVISVDPESLEFAKKFVAESNFTNTGPLLAVQAGASQGKRQWAPHRFAKFIDAMTKNYGARVVLTGTSKELPIIEEIMKSCSSENVAIAAGITNVPQLAGLIQLSDLLVTGDTGPMHISVAVGTPVVAMFLASAFGFETGPYSEGSIVLQPVIECGPCNPNKGCAKPDCHETIEPEVLAKVVDLRLKSDIRTLSPEIVDPKHIIAYRTFFDENGFYNMQPLNCSGDRFDRMRKAYRRMWLDDLAGLTSNEAASPRSKLGVVPEAISALSEVEAMANEGMKLIGELRSYIQDTRSAPQKLRDVSEALSALDVQIERTGFHYPELGLLTRMFVFGKENLCGTEALDLASQMGEIYRDLGRRSQKLAQYF